MRIRSIKPEFWTSEDIAALDWNTRLLFIGLWSYVDDNGVGRDVERLIVADLFPLEDDPRDTLATVSRGLASLAARRLIARYTVNGRPFLHICTWDKHQKIDRPAKPRYPLPTCADAPIRDTLATPSRDLRDSLDAGTGEQGNRGTEEQGNSETTTSSRARTARSTATRVPDPFPLTDDLKTWARTECPGVGMSEHERFMDYWRGVGGAKGRKVDWEATWRNWMRRAQDEGRGHRAGSTADQRFQDGMQVAAHFDAMDAARELASVRLAIVGGESA